MVSSTGLVDGRRDERPRSVEETLSAAFEAGLARLSEAVAQAAGRETRWLDRVRAGLVALLCFLEDEPRWGRVLIVETFARGGAASEWRQREQRVLGVLTRLLDDGSPQAIAESMPEPRLTAELLIGGVLSVIRARLSGPEGDARALAEMLPSLMSLIALAYLGQADASAELAADGPDPSRVPQLPLASAGASPVPVTYRTALVLGAIARAPRSSNREIAAAAGLGDEGQTSHLLRRLAQRGLIEKVSPRNGSRREKAWLLTPCGQRVIELLGLANAARHASADAGVREAA